MIETRAGRATGTILLLGVLAAACGGGGGTTDTATDQTAAPADTSPPTGVTAPPVPRGDTAQLEGSAYGFYTKVSLFGGPEGTRGPEPSVTLPAEGSARPVMQDVPTGKAQFGPAAVFESGAISVSTSGTPGAGGSVQSSASVTGIPDGPAPFLYEKVASSCTADERGVTGSTVLTRGVLETKYNPDKPEGEPVETVPVPERPAPNTERTGTLDHVGDSYRIVFNEQVRNADGSLAVNGVHIYLLGPTAKGELVIGQVVCG